MVVKKSIRNKTATPKRKVATKRKPASTRRVVKRATPKIKTVSEKRPTPKKKAVAKKKAATKRKPASTRRVAKRATPKIKTVSEKRPTPKKKAVAKKKAATKRKPASTRRVVKRASPKIKTVSEKRPTPKKKAVTKKKTATKKRVTAKRKIGVAVKKPTKAELRAEKARIAKEEKKKRRIELLNKRAVVNLPVEGITPYTAPRGESYMSPKQLEHFRSILLRWKQELLDEAGRTVDHMKKDASQFADPADRATQEEEFSLELRTRNRESKLVRKINQTLATIDADEYGYCESCGIDIGIKRLEARPTATLCIDCKTLQEIKEKQTLT